MTAQRTLLLAPPSIASHEDALRDVYTTFNRSTSDLTMLDRLSSSLVSLPTATYDLVVVLTGEAGAWRSEATQILTRRVYDAVAGSMKPGAILRAQGGPSLPEAEAILAGLVSNGDGTFVKAVEEAPVLLRLGGKKKTNGVATNGHSSNGNGGVALTKTQPVISLLPDDDLDGFGNDDDDELIDEDTLLTEQDINMKIQPPAECIPKIGKRRRACKDCTCGLAAKLEAEDRTRRAKADADLSVLKLGADDLDDLALDFTVKGKVGSCGSCSLGDAFRCADCPYIGLPAFKPGEEVTILNNVAQL
ncbi:cytokine-induced anti-apoptosis inhibitor 1, Fe-S biogenesis-domain-containing protein [Xylaria telfairii]|nr:cytokine-induced anti-apoptosis inhibitor 1, Fe-S biogenesis-domain-containing protein [Xylaria telfairii]